MATYPWRFQADLKLDEPDPLVTVFIGDVFTNDTTGEKEIQRSMIDALTVQLSELPAFLSTARSQGVTRPAPLKPDPLPPLPPAKELTPIPQHKNPPPPEPIVPPTRTVP